MKSTNIARSALRGSSVLSAALLAYTVVGYPAISLLAARLMPPRQKPTKKYCPQSVALIVPAHNEATVIAQKVRNIAALELPCENFECVIVDDGSTDGTAEIAHKEIAQSGASFIRVVSQEPRQGKMAALQRGIDETSSELVAISDAECLWPTTAFANLLPPFADDSVGATNGRFVVSGSCAEIVANESMYLRYELALKKSECRLGSITGVYGGCLAIRRQLLPELPSTIINDDFYLAMAVPRQGKRIEFTPDVVVQEIAVSSWHDDRNRRRRMLRGRLQSLAMWRTYLPLNQPVVMWQVWSHKYLRLALPLTILGTSVATLLLAVSTPKRRSSWVIIGIHTALIGLAAGKDQLPKKLRPLARIGSMIRYLGSYSIAAVEAAQETFSAEKSGHLWQRVEK